MTTYFIQYCLECYYPPINSLRMWGMSSFSRWSCLAGW